MFTSAFERAFAIQPSPSFQCDTTSVIPLSLQSLIFELDKFPFKDVAISL